MRFVGRRDYFERLDAEIGRVRAGDGRMAAVRGRRQVGKSRLLTEWLRRRGGPSVYYQARNKPPAQELEAFGQAVARADLGAVSSLLRGGAVWPSWDAALEALATAAKDARGDPLVVVLDELPYITNNDPSFEGVLQAVWDQELQHSQLLLVMVGSDLAMMEALTSYGRPLYNRVDAEIQVEPLNPAEVGELLGADAAETFDTYLMTGGFPKVVAACVEQPSRQQFLNAAMADEAHPLVYTGQRMLDAEFPPNLSARAVLEAIGHGERTFTKIRRRAGVSEGGLVAALDLLRQKRVIAAEDPLSARTIQRRTRYRTADPYLRFWLRFLANRTDDIARGRGDLVATEIDRSWQDYAGQAVEPLVRQSLERLMPDERFGAARYVGSFWGRGNQPQVDLVGTAGADENDRVEFAGSVKWRARKYFGPDDAAELEEGARQVPGWETTSLRVGVSRTGFTKSVELDVMLEPDDLLAAWR